MNRVICVLLAFASCLFFTVTAGAKELKGFSTVGNYSGSKVSFGFDTGHTVTIHNNDANTNPDYYEIWPGTDIYIPVGVMGASGQAVSIATDKDIKENEVTLSWKAAVGERYIDDIAFADGKKTKVDGLESGTYVKIALNENYTGRSSTPIRLDLVLSVKRLSYPETLTTLKFDIVNREINIDRDTVYPAQSPTQFYAMRHYGGKATFDFGNNVIFETTVEKGQRYFLSMDRSVDEDIAAMYPDDYLEYYNFKGDRDTFPSTGALRIPIDRSKFTPKGESKAQVFVYEVLDGYLRALDERVLSFDGKKNVLTVNTKTLGFYLLSGRALHKDLDNPDDDIIYTGYSSEKATPADSSDPAGVSTASPTGNTGDNPNTGRAVNADNASADNPSTSDTPLLPIYLGALSSGLIALYGWKNNWQRRKSAKQ